MREKQLKNDYGFWLEPAGRTVTISQDREDVGGSRLECGCTWVVVKSRLLFGACSSFPQFLKNFKPTEKHQGSTVNTCIRHLDSPIANILPNLLQQFSLAELLPLKYFNILYLLSKMIFSCPSSLQLSLINLTQIHTIFFSDIYSLLYFPWIQNLVMTTY